MPLAMLLIPLIPSLLLFIQKLVELARGDPGLPAATREQLSEIALRLDATAAAVAAVEFRDV